MSSKRGLGQPVGPGALAAAPEEPEGRALAATGHELQETSCPPIDACAPAAAPERTRRPRPGGRRRP
ncbi:hypothetical protein [Brevibacillus agri]|uniref:hypothetical protein n=1 Tax=Brevibacillus agri TaxID=51101 RepID=UPI0018CEE8BB|nr:hypothetical protein [Brevibacillus agri]